MAGSFVSKVAKIVDTNDFFYLVFGFISGVFFPQPTPTLFTNNESVLCKTIDEIFLSGNSQSNQSDKSSFLKNTLDPGTLAAIPPQLPFL